MARRTLTISRAEAKNGIMSQTKTFQGYTSKMTVFLMKRTINVKKKTTSTSVSASLISWPISNTVSGNLFTKRKGSKANL